MASDTQFPLEILGGHEFENVVDQLLTKMGFAVHGRRPSADGGIDMVAVRDEALTGGKFIVQCKRYSNPVAVEVVRDLYGVVHSEHANKGILITTSRFTAAAIEFAGGKPLELIDGATLHGLLQQYGIGSGGAPSPDQPRILPGWHIAYAQLCKPLEAIIAESGRIANGLVFLEKKARPLDARQYAVNFIPPHLEQIRRTLTFVASQMNAISEGINRREPTPSHLDTLRSDIEEFVRAARSLLGEQGDAYGVVPPIEFRRTHDAYLKIVPELMKDLGAFPKHIRDGVEGRLTAGRHDLVITPRNAPVVNFVTAFENDKRQLLQMQQTRKASPCFVATATYGDPSDPRVMELRRFRDRYLLPNPVGRRLVEWYYVISPPLATFISHVAWARRFSGVILRPITMVAKWLNAASGRHRDVKRPGHRVPQVRSFKRVMDLVAARYADDL